MRFEELSLDGRKGKPLYVAVEADGKSIGLYPVIGDLTVPADPSSGGYPKRIQDPVSGRYYYVANYRDPHGENVEDPTEPKSVTESADWEIHGWYRTAVQELRERQRRSLRTARGVS